MKSSKGASGSGSSAFSALDGGGGRLGSERPLSCCGCITASAALRACAAVAACTDERRWYSQTVAAAGCRAAVCSGGAVVRK